MTAVILVSPRFQFNDANGDPLAGGTIDVYLAGTTTRTNTWQDRSQSILNTNPIILDGSGACTIWLDPSLSYKLVVKDLNGVVQPHLGGDNIIGSGANQSITDLTTASLASMQNLFNIQYIGGKF